MSPAPVLPEPYGPAQPRYTYSLPDLATGLEPVPPFEASDVEAEELEPAAVSPGTYVLEELRALMDAAETRYGLAHGLLAAIAVHESGGGVHPCYGTLNIWGYGSCRLSFPATWEEAVELVAQTLAGYGGDTWWQACVWNAGAAGCRAGNGHAYADRVLATMAAW